MWVVRYVGLRLVQTVPVLIGITLIAFFSIHLVPGDPIRIMTNGRVSNEAIAEIYRQLGMDQPLPIQYVRFVAHALVGDLGISIIQKAPVSKIVGERLLPSIFLLGYSAVISAALAIPLAILAAQKRNQIIDHLIRIGGTISFAMPSFWVGLLLILFFGLTLKWFPISGYGEGFAGHLHHLFLPALVIALFLSPMLIQALRSSILNAMTADYIEVARAKGLGEQRILLKYVLRAALIPVVTILAVNVGWLVSGSVIVESVFSIAGLGSLLVQAVSTRDYPVLQGLTIVFSLLVIVVNLLADLAYATIDRRVREDT